jgi:hypothetical protein
LASFACSPSYGSEPDCVVMTQSWTYGSGPEGQAVSHILGVALYKTVAECNADAWGLLQLYSVELASSQIWDGVESLDFGCDLPDQCEAADELAVEPDHFVYLRSDWQANRTFEEAMAWRMRRFKR